MPGSDDDQAVDSLVGKAVGRILQVVGFGIADLDEGYGVSPSFGGDLIDRDTYLSAEGVINGPESVAFGEWFQGLFDDGYASRTPTEGSQDFLQGRVPLVLTGGWNVIAAVEAHGEDEVLILPPVDFGVGSKTGAGSWQWGVSSGCANQEVANDFIEFLMQDEHLVAYSDALGNFPSTQAATQDWDNSKAQARMDSLLSGFYSDKTIDGVLSPNDGIARAILTATEQAGQELPVVSGLDAENESISWIWKGRQYSTVAKPTQDLVAKTMELITALQKGEALPEANDNQNNGTVDVPVFALEPTVVTKENIEEVFANDPERLALLTD